MQKKLLHYRSQDVYDNLPELVVKNDLTMQAFRDLFQGEPDPVTKSSDVVQNGKLADSADFGERRFINLLINMNTRSLFGNPVYVLLSL